MSVVILTESSEGHHAALVNLEKAFATIIVVAE